MLNIIKFIQIYAYNGINFDMDRMERKITSAEMHHVIEVKSVLALDEGQCEGHKKR